MKTTLSSLALKEEGDDLSKELELYFENKFSSQKAQPNSLLIDEPYISSWESYATDSVGGNAFSILKMCYPQLNFPIEEGINKTEDYVDTVLRGKNATVKRKSTLNLIDPEGIEINIFESIAGKVPVIKVPNNQDFKQIIQSLLYKNNPISVPDSMGAILINGINNWDRLHSLKQDWLANNPLENWNEEFVKNVLPNSGLFKDRIIILSTKPYSNVSASSLAISESEWKLYSYSIRLEHECTHLFTLKKYGNASNNLHDELIADYVGITKTIGYYSMDWMLAFMGLENYPTYRKGARLENYLGSSDLSFENFEKLTTIIKNAITNIADFDDELGKVDSANDQIARIDALCKVSVLEIASENGKHLLLIKYKEAISKEFI